MCKASSGFDLVRSSRIHRLTQRSLVSVLCGLALAGCASAGGASRPEGGGPNVLVRAELAQYDDVDAFTAVQRLRNTWLRARGGTRSPPELIVDGVRRIGGVRGLAAIRVASIERMEYMSGPDATMRYGTGFPGGAILVYLLKG